MTQNIAAVVVTYNRKALLKKCIDHILKQSAGAPDILVIDNASTDGTGGFITEEYKDVPEVKYYNTGVVFFTSAPRRQGLSCRERQSGWRRNLTERLDYIEMYISCQLGNLCHFEV